MQQGVNLLAFVFPGQGSQFVGMGKEWCEKFAEARQTFEEAEDLLSLDLRQIAFEGPLDQLSLTYRSQLTIFTASMAIWRVLLSRFQPSNVICAGMSLGEFSALAASEKGTFAQILHLVERRAHLMDQACKRVASGMLAVMGMTAEQVQELIAKAQLDHKVWIANYNAPTQLVIAGDVSSLTIAESLAAKANARTSWLKVEGGFHSPLMLQAQETFCQSVSTAHLRSSNIAFASGVSAQIEDQIESIRSHLGSQMTRPVRWWQTVQLLAGLHPRCFVEIGGKTLTALHRRIGVKTPAIALSEVCQLQNCFDLLS